MRLTTYGMNKQTNNSLDVLHWVSVFNRAIDDYHINDDVNQPLNNPFAESTLEALLYRKCWIDTVQWHLEDIIRDPDIDAENGMEIKRRIDRSNQKRTDLVERLDDEFIVILQLPSEQPDTASLSTESLAWAIDRLSILALKLYHMNVEVERAPQDKEAFLKAKLVLLHTQKRDLVTAISQLMNDAASGKRYYKVYRQVKMYNDPSLNPVLYGKPKQ